MADSRVSGTRPLRGDGPLVNLPDGAIAGALICVPGDGKRPSKLIDQRGNTLKGNDNIYHAKAAEVWARTPEAWFRLIDAATKRRCFLQFGALSDYALV